MRHAWLLSSIASGNPTAAAAPDNTPQPQPPASQAAAASLGDNNTALSSRAQVLAVASQAWRTTARSSQLVDSVLTVVPRKPAHRRPSRYSRGRPCRIESVAAVAFVLLLAAVERVAHADVAVELKKLVVAPCSLEEDTDAGDAAASCTCASV